MSGSDDSRVSRLWGRRGPAGYAQIDDEEKVDLSRDRFPYCVVWTPLPVLSWLIPFIGHVHDFAGPYCVSVDAMAFARPMRFMPMYPTEREREGWDEAVTTRHARQASTPYGRYRKATRSSNSGCTTSSVTIAITMSWSV
ncbi:hypothetical protein FOZ63_010404 [Perkinsus olseni]|uniref:Uncharacterized protein n=1 Tax=Perkinsus olseni TaxID=32597 RepID=A0A7J6UBP1_PEROL|nr:hypothetical protein FOZ63_010404 [Perkinsus olseni]